MARMDPYPLVHVGYQPSRTGMAIDAASGALQTYLAQKQKDQQESQAAEQLVPYIQGLDQKSQTALLTKLSAEQPTLFQKVATKITPTPPPPPDPLDAAKQKAYLDLLTGPAPTDPAELALWQSRRNSYLYGDKFAAAAPIAGQVDRSVLPPAAQPNAIAVATNTAPKADTILTTDTTKRGQDISATTQRRGQDITAETTRRGQDIRQTTSGATANANDVADAVASMKAGTAPPLLPGRATKQYVAVLAEAKRQGYDVARANMDWTATQKHLATLNGAQQTRLRQAVDATSGQIDNIEQLYNEWKQAAGVSGIKVFNKANLAASKQLPGPAGAAAQALESHIALATGEMGNVLMGGNSPTDHALALTSKMLQADWNDETFTKALKQLRIDLTIRKNSLANSTPAGTSDTNPYGPKTAPAGKPGDPMGILN